MVVKSTAFSVPYNIVYRINILIGLTLINMFIKTKTNFFLFFRSGYFTNPRKQIK